MFSEYGQLRRTTRMVLARRPVPVPHQRLITLIQKGIISEKASIEDFLSRHPELRMQLNDPAHGTYAIVEAAKKGYSAVVESLIEADAHTDVSDKDGWTLQEIASAKGFAGDLANWEAVQKTRHQVILQEEKQEKRRRRKKHKKHKQKHKREHKREHKPKHLPAVAMAAQLGVSGGKKADQLAMGAGARWVAAALGGAPREKTVSWQPSYRHLPGLSQRKPRGQKKSHHRRSETTFF